VQFLLIAHPRTGTTLLRSLLNRHEKIYVYGEVLYPGFFPWGFYSKLQSAIQGAPDDLLPTRWAKYLEPCLAPLISLMNDAGKSVVGFDAKIPQIAIIPNFHHSVLTAGFAILHLRRRNTLAAIVSYETMARRVASGGVAHGTNRPETMQLHLQPEWLSLRIEELENQDKWIKFTYQKSRYAELWYEDFAAPQFWPKASSRLSSFFEVDIKLPFDTELMKQNPIDLRRMIVNSEEIESLFPQFFAAPVDSKPGVSGPG
jgi:hypothetical protein